MLPATGKTGVTQVLLVAIGSHGDVLPFIAIGAELARRGHGVILAAPAPFQHLTLRAGLAFHELCTREEYDRVVGVPELWHPRRGVGTLLAAVSGLIEPTYRWISDNWTPGESVVVASTLSFGARVAEDRLGVPVVTIHLAPFLIDSRYAPPRLPGLPLPDLLPPRVRHWLGAGAEDLVLGPAALPGLNTFRAGLGLPPVLRLRDWWSSPGRVILAFPSWIAPRQPDWPPSAVQVGFPKADTFGEAGELGPELTAFLRDGDRPIAFTYGSAMRQGARFFETAIQISRRMGRRAVFLAPQQGQVPPILPAGIVHVSYAPLSKLLPRCAALVHHGGVGTMAQGLAAGLPQVVVPVAFDHFDEGARLERLGIGATIARRRFTAARGARHLHRLLSSPTVAERCTLAKQRMLDENGVEMACDEIERTQLSRDDAVLPRPIFDVDFYRAQRPSNLGGMGPLQHYLQVGWREGRDPCAGFSTDGYLRVNPDVRAAGMNPFVHFWNYGRLEGRAGWRTSPPRRTGGSGAVAGPLAPGSPAAS